MDAVELEPLTGLTTVELAIEELLNNEADVKIVYELKVLELFGGREK